MFLLHLARGWPPGAQSGALHNFGGDVLLLASMLVVESPCPIGTPNTLSRWASFGLDVGLIAVAAARRWSPGAQSGALHNFGGDLLSLASMVFVESPFPIGTSNTLSRWASFGLDVGLLAVAVARGWSPGAHSGCIALFRWRIAIAGKHAFRRISDPYKSIKPP